ncbi:hypothetical protein QUB60_25015 [Microcoleus sp. A2-C5]
MKSATHLIATVQRALSGVYQQKEVENQPNHRLEDLEVNLKPLN